MSYLGRSAGLTGYLELAREVGLDAYKLAAAAGVPAAALTDPALPYWKLKSTLSGTSKW